MPRPDSPVRSTWSRPFRVECGWAAPLWAKCSTKLDWWSQRRLHQRSRSLQLPLDHLSKNLHNLYLFHVTVLQWRSESRLGKMTLRSFLWRHRPGAWAVDSNRNGYRISRQDPLHLWGSSRVRVWRWGQSTTVLIRRWSMDYQGHPGQRTEASRQYLGESYGIEARHKSWLSKYCASTESNPPRSARLWRSRLGCRPHILLSMEASLCLSVPSNLVLVQSRCCLRCHRAQSWTSLSLRLSLVSSPLAVANQS